MPKSKRNKVVSLTKTDKKNSSEHKTSKIEEIRDALKEYKYFYTYTTDNTRNQVLKQLRLDWRKDSRFFETKRRLIQVAFGRNESTEVFPGLAKLANRVNGDVALLMTNKEIDDIRQQLDTYNEYDYARAGNLAISTVIVKAGSLKDFVSHSEEPYLRTKLNLPVKLDRGVVHLLQDVRICTFKDKLSALQALQLKTFKVKLAEFRINLDAMYCTNSSKVVEFEKENVEKRMLDHLTYNKITIEDGDYQYSWDDQETERAENGFKSGVNDSGMEVEGEDEAMMMPAGMM